MFLIVQIVYWPELNFMVVDLYFLVCEATKKAGNVKLATSGLSASYRLKMKF